ncbi:hypothetical protein EBU91_05125, partial [bacterium]|nr:hypothetical protein [bacterium]
MCWTGWDNVVNLKYFWQNISDDVYGISNKEQYNHRFCVYDSDTNQISIEIAENESLKFKKIYQLMTSPADQFMSKKYFYIRKTPKFLNDYSVGNTFTKLTFQFQDEGEKFDYEICTSDGLTASVPRGANEMVDNSHWGYYDSYSSLDKVSDASHIGHDFGYLARYNGITFMGLTMAMPYVDCPEMWKNQFDLTTIHPNLGARIIQNEKTFLQKVLDIRYDTFKETFGVSKQLEKIRQIERQNFISYVLCCLKEQKEESFFAALLGYEPERRPYNQQGVNEEWLKYRYYWAKIKIVPDENAIPYGGTGQGGLIRYGLDGTHMRAFENQLWQLDIGNPPQDPITGKPNGEWSGNITDFKGYLAVNISERTNWYEAIGLTFSGLTIFPYFG